MKFSPVVILWCAVTMAQLQGAAMAQDSQSTEAAVQAAQYRAGIAYRQLQQAQHETKLAEQDYLNAQEARRLVQNNINATKADVESARRAFDAAQAKALAARKAYEQEINTVDRLQKRPGAAAIK